MPRIRVFVLLLATAALGGCVRVHPTYLAGGEQGYALACSMFGTDWESCLVKAGKLCQSRGYHLAYADEVEGKLVIGCNAATASIARRQADLGGAR